ncbi:MAG: DUF6600 domain-containing protein [Verrucomicrobiota bacterium]|jgi:hypothetical protein
MKIESFQKHILGTAITVLCLTGIRSPFNSPAQAQSASPPPDSATESSALPPNIYPTSPLAQVVRLTQAGVDESVIMTYVTNSGSTFNLDSDKIIYLKDIGLPNEVVTAMIQRDQQLQQQMNASAYQPPAQPAPGTTEQPETAPSPQPVEQPAEVTVNYFYDTLTPYGTWVNVDGYGRCWRPSVVIYNPGWQPYCDHGHWVYTDCGWYWSSDYSWGWAPFHYGRWFQHSRWGWCWTPDIVWGPSWVTWRYSSDYCGWAPLPPFAGYREGVGFFYRDRNVSIGFDFGLSINCFTFVPIGHFCDPHPRRFRAAPTQVTQIYNHTTVINNFNVRDHNFVNRGIDPEHITAVTRTPIHPVSIRDTGSPSGHGQRGDQLSHDGRTLVVNRPHFVDHPVPGETRNNRPNNRPMPSVSPAQNHSPQPNGNQSAPPTRQMRQPQVPNATPHGPQDRNEFSAPNQPQHPSPPANSPTPGRDNRTFSPQGHEQLQPSEAPRSNPRNSEAPVITPIPGQGQHSAPEAGRRNPPSAKPVERPQQNEFSVPNQPQRPSPPANPSTLGQDNRTFSPRGREQLQPSEAPRGNPHNSEAPAATPHSNRGQSGASEASRHSAPAAAPAQPQPQHNQPSSSPPPSSSPRSSGQNQNQNSSGNGSGRGPGH